MDEPNLRQTNLTAFVRQNDRLPPSKTRKTQLVQSKKKLQLHGDSPDDSLEQSSSQSIPDEKEKAFGQVLAEDTNSFLESEESEANSKQNEALVKP